MWHWLHMLYLWLKTERVCVCVCVPASSCVLRAHLQISWASWPSPVLTGNQSVSNRKWMKISCENSLTLLSVSVWSCPLYIAEHWRHQLLCDIKAQEERCGASLCLLTPTAAPNLTPFNYASFSQGESTWCNLYHRMTVCMWCDSVDSMWKKVCIDIACLCVFLCAHCMVCMHENMCACGKIEIVSPVT